MRVPVRPVGVAATAGRPLRIALFGLFGRGNLGNDASLEAILAFIRRARPAAEIFCICQNPDVVRQTFGIATVPIRWKGRFSLLPERPERLFQKLPARIVDLAHAVRQLRNTDVMIIPGTGILDDFGERPGGMPFDILKWCAAARITGTRSAFVSIGAGPIRNARSRFMMVTAARLAQYRSYRDEESRSFMAEQGIDARRGLIFPDLVFGLQPPAPPSPVLSAPDTPPAAAGRLTVGVGIMCYRGWYGFDDSGADVFGRYIDKLAGFVRHLLENGHRVKLLIGDSDDWPAVEVIRSRFPAADRSRLAAPPIASLHDVMAQMASTDLVVATRFHNIVCALKLARPTISIGYADKNDALMAKMGLGAFCHHIDRLDLDDLIRQFERMAASRAEVAGDLVRRCDMLEQAFAWQETQLLSRLL